MTQPATGPRGAYRRIRARLKWMRDTDAWQGRPVAATWRALRFLAADVSRAEVRFVTHDGLRFASPPNNFSSFAMCVTGARDAHLWRFIERRVRPGAVFVDAGANVGTYAVPAARLVGPAGRVIAYEAHPAIMEFLVRNIAANGLSNVTASNLALGAEPGRVRIAFARHNPGETHVAATDEVAPDAAEVAMTTLDVSLAALGVRAVDYLKVDVEGFELPVLQGARATIAASPAIVVQTEMEQAHSARYGHSRRAMAALLSGLGLRPHLVRQDGSATPEDDAPERMRHGDVVWFRP